MANVFVNVNYSIIFIMKKNSRMKSIGKSIGKSIAIFKKKSIARSIGNTFELKYWYWYWQYF